jgi:UDP-3-O-[3-hydroxymyristoyl] N-acetylglucosamine deacetylase/3-hydroxyacyl-[acyl-carrier-protein] dehydratase|tara:strand:- start:7751 stop:9142 length:1392 start_codon:yes stop_codon:yes gene_type:complete
MINFQRTINEEGNLEGIGLHTGKKSKLKFVPAVINHGIKFQRIDLDGMPIIDADVNNVIAVERGTTIKQNDATISTVEHLLAAIVGLQIDNILIQIDGEEIPILDGSSKYFIECLEKCGLKTQDAARKYIEISEKITYNDEENNVEISIYPHNDYRITSMVDYNSEILGSQHYTLNQISNFKKDVSDARTFCFLHEIEDLFKKNLIKGGDLDNAIVIVDKVIDEKKLKEISQLLGKKNIKVDKQGILNNIKLKYNNEPARHKLLDIVGDLALVGRPIKGHIIAARPGHKSNIEFAKILKNFIKKRNINAPKYDPNQKPVFDINGVKNIMKHRYPFLLVDKITYLDESEVVGVKNVTVNEDFFNGHFPGNPVMPGVLQIEALAQVGGILVMNSIEEPEKHIPYLAGIENFRFRKMVSPGDTLVMRLRFIAPIKRGIAKMKAEAFVGNNLVSEGNMTATISKINE